MRFRVRRIYGPSDQRADPSADSRGSNVECRPLVDLVAVDDHGTDEHGSADPAPIPAPRAAPFRAGSRGRSSDWMAERDGDFCWPRSCGVRLVASRTSRSTLPKRTSRPATGCPSAGATVMKSPTANSRRSSSSDVTGVWAMQGAAPIASATSTIDTTVGRMPRPRTTCQRAIISANRAPEASAKSRRSLRRRMRYRTPGVSRFRTSTLRQLRRYAIARSLFKVRSLPRAIARLGFVQADPMRAGARPAASARGAARLGRQDSGARPGRAAFVASVLAPTPRTCRRISIMAASSAGAPT